MSVRDHKGEPMVVPCVECGRTGIAYADSGLCATCRSRRWRAENIVRARELTRASKRRLRAIVRVRELERARAEGVRVSRGQVVCVECGAPLLERSPSGRCNFCIEEAEMTG